MRLEQGARLGVSVETFTRDLKSPVVVACKEQLGWPRCSMSSLLAPCVSESDSRTSCQELRFVDTTARPPVDD
jgi:hypothetical protein